MHFLRNKDREMHRETYPALFYPEMYLLEGGYKAFFESHKTLCEPICYTPMMHTDHVADRKHFRAKSKSWTAAGSDRTQTRVQMSRQLSDRQSSMGRQVCRKLPWPTSWLPGVTDGPQNPHDELVTLKLYGLKLYVSECMSELSSYLEFLGRYIILGKWTYFKKWFHLSGRWLFCWFYSTVVEFYWFLFEFFCNFNSMIYCYVWNHNVLWYLPYYRMMEQIFYYNSYSFS